MKWPNLKHLHYLVTLHQEQHFHRAAQRCNVSQSTLSTAIQNLEEHFGSQLLEREHKTFVFTSLGLDVVERSKVILQEAGELVEQLGEQLVDLENSPEDADLLNGVFSGFPHHQGWCQFSLPGSVDQGLS